MREFGLQFEALGVLGLNICRKQSIILFEKMRVCFHQLFDLSTPKASNSDPTARYSSSSSIADEKEAIYLASRQHQFTE